jgi:cytochrome c oxidase subunit 4
MTHGTESLSGHGTAPGGAPAAGEHEAGHPGERTYVEVAAILAAITVVEVAVYYIQWVHDKGLLVPLLLALSAIKFATVVGYFMHLKFDDRRLTYIFASGLIVAFSIIMALYALFHWHPIDYARSLL